MINLHFQKIIERGWQNAWPFVLSLTRRVLRTQRYLAVKRPITWLPEKTVPPTPEKTDDHNFS